MTAARDRIRRALADPGTSHREIARRLGVSASSVDRACRALRQATQSECTHGRALTHERGAPDAPADAPRDATQGHGAPASPVAPECVTGAPAGASPGAGNDAPWRAKVVELRPRRQEPDAPGGVGAVTRQPTTAGDSATAERWVCGCCSWRQAVATVDRCEFCGWARAREVPR